MALTAFITSEGTNKKEVKDAAGNVVEPAVVTRQITTEYDFGANLQEAVEKFGEAVVFSAFIASAKVDAQALVRRYMKSKVAAIEGISPERDYTDDEIKAKLGEWKPGLKSERTAASVTEKAEALIGKMTDEQKQAFIAQLMAKASE